MSYLYLKSSNYKFTRIKDLKFYILTGILPLIFLLTKFRLEYLSIFGLVSGAVIVCLIKFNWYKLRDDLIAYLILSFISLIIFPIVLNKLSMLVYIVTSQIIFPIFSIIIYKFDFKVFGDIKDLFLKQIVFGLASCIFIFSFSLFIINVKFSFFSSILQIIICVILLYWVKTERIKFLDYFLILPIFLVLFSQIKVIPSIYEANIISSFIMTIVIGLISYLLDIIDKETIFKFIIISIVIYSITGPGPHTYWIYFGWVFLINLIKRIVFELNLIKSKKVRYKSKYSDFFKHIFKIILVPVLFYPFFSRNYINILKIIILTTLITTIVYYYYINKKHFNIFLKINTRLRELIISIIICFIFLVFAYLKMYLTLTSIILVFLGSVSGISVLIFSSYIMKIKTDKILVISSVAFVNLCVLFINGLYFLCFH